VISARAHFEKLMPSNFLFLIFLDGFKEWKHRTFLTLAEKMNKDLITNIVAIGDS